MSSFWGDGSPVVSAPAVISGSVGLSPSFGVISGTGLSPAARTANGAALQSVINYAIANNKYVEADAGTYEFDLPGGLVIDGGGFTWRGSRNTVLTQFASNTPVITLGKATSNSDGSLAMSIDGLNAQYGVDQTGNTSANAIVMASSWMSRYSRIFSGVAPGASFAPYRSIYFNGGGSDAWWFSNSLRDSKFAHAQHEIWRHNLLSTGCSYENIYIGGGAPTITAYSGTPVIFSRGGKRGQGCVFNQFNIEWISGNNILYLDNCKQYVFNSFHIEGCQLTGAAPYFFFINNAEVQGSGWDLENCKILSANFTGNAGLFGGWAQAKVTIDGMRLGWLTVAQTDVNVNAAYRLMHFGGERDGFGSRVRLTNFYIEGGGNYGYNTLITTGDAPFPTTGTYVYDGNEQYFENGSYQTIDTDFTVYGCHRNLTVRYAASLAANRTLVLSGKKGSAGWQATANVPPGSMMHLYRQAGTAVNTVTVKNLTSGGTTLATNSTADSHMRFQFDGTNWAQVQ